jgi:ribose 5-phosphate isomerase B
MHIYLGSDHRGFALKQEIINWLKSEGHSVTDCGNTEYQSDDDFTEYAFAVGEKVAADPGSRGIVLCGTGVGVAIAANKVPTVRAHVATTPQMAADGRKHDDTNVVAISADTTPLERAQAIISAFLTTSFEDTPRRKRRVEQLNQYATAAG